MTYFKTTVIVLAAMGAAGVDGIADDLTCKSHQLAGSKQARSRLYSHSSLKILLLLPIVRRHLWQTGCLRWAPALRRGWGSDSAAEPEVLRFLLLLAGYQLAIIQLLTV